MSKYTWQALEDNGGGLHLAVFDEDDAVIYFHSGFEFCVGELTECIEQLKQGEAPENWEGNEEDPHAMYEDVTRFEYGWKVVADENGIYRDVMGNAASKEFGVTDEDN